MALTLPQGAEGADLIEWVASHLLPLVQRPARYCGGGFDATPRRPEHGEVLLAFPDVYEIGVGHVGSLALRDAIERRGYVAERTYCPWPDMEALMRRHEVPLYSLDSFRPASSFDVIGITLQHELSYTNVLTLMDLAGLPVRQADRGDGDPYVVGGGPATCNPEPMADFFDLIVVGEGEDVVADLVPMLCEAHRTRRPRREVLMRAATIPGVYVPSLYRVEGADGTRGMPRPWAPGIPERIVARRVARLSPSCPTLSPPLVAPTHDRCPVEIMRGCPRRCRFCQARVYYGPVRRRAPEAIVSAVAQAADEGWDEVSLLSLSTSDYPTLDKLLAMLNEICLERRVGISLPSLRAESFSQSLCEQLRRTPQRGLTFAPEAGSERLRASIGKELSDDDLLHALDRAFSHGWTNAKLYFMVGLPGETEEDVEAIPRLVRRAVALARRHGTRRLAVSCAPFVPKPQTEFEREPFLDPTELRRRELTIGAMLPRRIVDYSWRNPILSQWEAILARGDRRIGDLVFEAWRRGARFDEWESNFAPEAWEAASKACGLDPAALIGPRPAPSPLPWDHFIFPRGPGAGGEEPPPSLPAAEPASGGSLHRMRVRYRKRGLRRFLSHLDMARVWALILRRARAHVAYTTGFSPRPRLSFGPALPVGMESEGEYLDFWTTRHDREELLAQVRRQCPEGIEVVDLFEVPLSAPSLECDLVFARYEATCPAHVRPTRHESIEGVSDVVADGATVSFTVRLATKGAPKPREVAARLAGVAGEEALLLPIRRVALWGAAGEGSRSPVEGA